MPTRHPRSIPTRWLMTDERMGDALWSTLRALPRGSGVVFRHYATSPGERRTLFTRIRRLARARGLVLLHAGAERLPRADGVHNARGRGLRSTAVHDKREALAARRRGNDLVFVAPVFATRSHSDAIVLGARKAARLGRLAGAPAIALGGMNERRFARLRRLGFHGWAGIDAWIGVDDGQNRNAVPI